MIPSSSTLIVVCCRTYVCGRMSKRNIVRLYKQSERDNRMVTSTIHMRLSLQWMLIAIFNDVDAYCLAVFIFFFLLFRLDSVLSLIHPLYYACVDDVFKCSLRSSISLFVCKRKLVLPNIKLHSN